MNGRVILSVLLVLGLMAALMGFGVFIYNAGVAQGAATSSSVEATTPPRPVYAYPYPYHYYGPWFFPFGLFGVLVPLAFIFFIGLGMMRAIWWRGRWGHHRGWYGQGNGDEAVPPRVAEWHRKLHEQGDQPRPS